VDALIERLFETVLTASGDTPPEWRRAAAAAGASPSALPGDLAAYAGKVASAADTVTSDDIERLLEGGHSEDAVFEVTLSAALGAARLRLERGLAAVRGGRP